jgi:hypothetical protein
VSSNYAGLNTYHGQIVIPSDGDPAVAESVNVALRDLMDNSVYASTELAHKLDDRGGTYTLTADLAIVGSQTFRVGSSDFLISSDTLFVGDVTIGIPAGPARELVVLTDATWLNSDTTYIGTGASHNLEVNAESEFNADAVFTEDVTIGSSSADDLDVVATAVFRNDASFEDDVTVGSSDADTFRVNAQTLFVSNVQINGTLNSPGNVTLGNAASDEIEVNGELTCSQDVQIDGDLTVDGDIHLGSGDTSSVEVQAATFLTRGNTTLGNQSSDELEINAALTSVLGFSGNGQVPFKFGTLTTGTGIDPSDGSTVFLLNQTGGGANNFYPIDSDGWVSGAFFVIVANSSVSSNGAIVQLPATGTGVQVGASTNRCVLFVKAGGGNWIAIQFGPSGTSTTYG